MKGYAPRLAESQKGNAGVAQELKQGCGMCGSDTESIRCA